MLIVGNLVSYTIDKLAKTDQGNFEI